MAGDPRFHSVLKQIAELHDRKSLDYGAKDDPYANVRASQEWGIAPWVGCFTRLNDKVHRLQQFAQKGSLANESAEDSMLDIAVYAIIAYVLYREESGVKERPAERPTSAPDVDTSHDLGPNGVCTRCPACTCGDCPTGLLVAPCAGAWAGVSGD